MLNLIVCKVTARLLKVNIIRPVDILSPVAMWSKAWTLGRALAGIVGSNLTGGHGCLSLVSVCGLSVRGLCDGLITLPEEPYRVWCV
jgi:hypothetical protein